jgi:hypothetical protein
MIKINSGVSQNSALRPVLYLLYIADIPVTLGIATKTYAIAIDDIAIFVAYNNPILTSLRL